MPRSSFSDSVSDAVHQHIFEALALPILLFSGKAATVLKANPACAQLLGYASSELEDLPLAQLLPKAEQAPFRKWLRAFQAHPSETQPAPLQLLTATSKPLSVLARLQVLDQFETSQPVYMLLLEKMHSGAAPQQVPSSDLWKDPLSKGSIQEFELLFSHLFSTIPVGIIIEQIDSDELVQVNAYFCELVGYSKEELQEIGFEGLSDADQWQFQLEQIVLLKEGQKDSIRFEKRYLHKSNIYIWTRLIVCAVRDEDEKLTHLITLVEDISQHKAQSEALRLSYSLQAATLESTADGIAVTEGSRLMSYNDKFLKMWGLSVKLLAQTQDIFEDKLILDQVKGAEPFSHQIRLLQKKQEAVALDMVYLQDGRIFERYSQPLWVIGKVAGRVWSFRDVTRQKRMEAELARKVDELDEKNQELERYIESNLQLENFAYFASHDLREPLRNITNFTQLLAKRYQGQLDDNAKDYIQFIVNGVKSMNRLIGDLLLYSKVNAAQQEIEVLDLNEVITDLLDTMGQSIAENKAQITRDKLPEAIPIARTRISQVYQNLIANAIKFHKPNKTPRVHLGCEKQGEKWLLSVADQGIGIRDDFHDKIFLLFKKLHHSARYEGTGIGLALCKKIIEQHEGKIWVESEEGKGSTFYFLLPAQVPVPMAEV